MFYDPWGEGEELLDSQYCCAICPSANDGSFTWNPIFEQLICGDCDREISRVFLWPESQEGVVYLYPPVLREIMAITGRSYRECRRIYLEYRATDLARDIVEDSEDDVVKVIIAPDGSRITRSDLLARIKSLLSNLKI